MLLSGQTETIFDVHDKKMTSEEHSGNFQVWILIGRTKFFCVLFKEQAENFPCPRR
jgi:hypothetical protein